MSEVHLGGSVSEINFALVGASPVWWEKSRFACGLV